MSYQFTPEEIADLQAVVTANTGAASMAAVYQKILDLISVPDGTGPKEGVDPSVWLWVNGAREVNAGSGAYSDFIRTYSAHQYQVRFGQTATSGLMQTASNQVGLNVAERIIAFGVLPDLLAIGTADADVIRRDYFGGDRGGWSGNLLFLYLGEDSFFENNILSDATAYDLLLSLDAARVANGMAALPV
jgi:hypothetical protein